MAIASIHDWLVTRGSFARGVELLKLHGRPTKADLYLYSLPESTMSRDRLVKALQAIDQISTEQVVQHNQAVAASAATPATSASEEEVLQMSIANDAPRDIQEDMLPPSLRPLRRQLSTMHRDMTLKRGIMIKTPDGMELKELALEIWQLDREIRSGWRRIEYWRRHGTLLDARTAAPDLASLKDERQRLRVWISQRRKGARKATPEQIEAKQKQLEAIETKLKDAAQP